MKTSSEASVSTRPTTLSSNGERGGDVNVILDALRSLVRELRLASREAEQRVGVHGGHERAAQFDPVSLDGVEASQRETDTVSARPQVNDLVLTRAVGDDRAGLLDECRTRSFDRHARQNRP